MGIQFVCDPREDIRQSDRAGLSVKAHVNYWKLKSGMMGTGMPPQFWSKVRPGATFLYGHNHRGGEALGLVDGKTIRFITHQSPQWKIHQS